MSIDANELLNVVARAVTLADPVRMPVAVLSHALGVDCTDVVRDGLIALARRGWVSLQTDPLTGHIDSLTLTPQGHAVATPTPPPAPPRRTTPNRRKPPRHQLTKPNA